MTGQLFIVDGLAARLVAEAGDGVVLAAAHLLETALDGVAALVVDAAADDVEQLFLLAVHILGQQQAAARVGGEQHLRQQLAHGREQLLPSGQAGALGEAREEADAVDLPDAPDDGLDGRAVELVQARGELFEIAVAGGAAPQDRGDQGVHRGGLASELGQQRDRQAGGLELVAAQMAEIHAGHELGSAVFHPPAPPNRFG